MAASTVSSESLSDADASSVSSLVGCSRSYSPFIKAVATNGTTVVPGADIEIYNEAVPHFGNNTYQQLPYDDTIRIQVRKDGALIADVSEIAVDGATSEIVVATSWVDDGSGDENNAPVAEDQGVSTDEDTAKAITLVATDADGDSLTYAIVSQPSNGTLSGAAPNVTYTPNENYNGSDSFTFEANDGTEDSNVATVAVTVVPVNDLPVPFLVAVVFIFKFIGPHIIDLRSG